jgi:hypothetical protein
MATAVLRHAEAPRVTIRVSTSPSQPARILLTLQADRLNRTMPPPDVPADRPWFLSGGFGLALVGAALVCETHGAEVAWGGPSEPTTITLRARA